MTGQNRTKGWTSLASPKRALLTGGSEFPVGPEPVATTGRRSESSALSAPARDVLESGLSIV